MIQYACNQLSKTSLKINEIRFMQTCDACFEHFSRYKLSNGYHRLGGLFEVWNDRSQNSKDYAATASVPEANGMCAEEKYRLKYDRGIKAEAAHAWILRVAVMAITVSWDYDVG